MPADFHHGLIWIASAFHVAYRAAPQIVEQQARQPARFARLTSPCELRPNRASMIVEHPQTIRRTSRKPRFKPRLHVAVDWHRPGSLPFRLRLGESDVRGFKINLLPPSKRNSPFCVPTW